MRKIENESIWMMKKTTMHMRTKASEENVEEGCELER